MNIEAASYWLILNWVDSLIPQLHTPRGWLHRHKQDRKILHRQLPANRTCTVCTLVLLIFNMNYSALFDFHFKIWLIKAASIAHTIICVATIV